MSDDRTKKAKRLHRTANAIKKQIRIAKNTWNAEHLLKQPHRFAKRHALDCGNPECIMCGNPRKVWKEKTIQEKRFDEVKDD